MPLLCSVSSGVGFIKIGTKKRTAQHPGVLNHGPRELVFPPKTPFSSWECFCHLFGNHSPEPIPGQRCCEQPRASPAGTLPSAEGPLSRPWPAAALCVRPERTSNGEYTTREHILECHFRDSRRFALTLVQTGALGRLRCSVLFGAAWQRVLSSAFRSHGRNTECAETGGSAGSCLVGTCFREQHILLRKTGFGEYIGKEFFKFKPIRNLTKNTLP